MHRMKFWHAALAALLVLLLAPHLFGGHETAAPPADEAEEGTPPTEQTAPQAEPAPPDSPPVISDEFRRQITEEVRAAVLKEVRAEIAKIVKEEIKQIEIGKLVTSAVTTELTKKQLAFAPNSRQAMWVLAQSGFGSVKGRVVWNGKPLANCLVKLRRLKSGPFDDSVVLSGVRVFVATTNEKGIYEFKDVPAGQYQWLWKAPQHTSWVRRLAKRADVVVKVNKTTTPKDLEANVRTLN